MKHFSSLGASRQKADPLRQGATQLSNSRRCYASYSVNCELPEPWGACVRRHCTRTTDVAVVAQSFHATDAALRLLLVASGHLLVQVSCQNSLGVLALSYSWSCTACSECAQHVQQPLGCINRRNSHTCLEVVFRCCRMAASTQPVLPTEAATSLDMRRAEKTFVHCSQAHLPVVSEGSGLETLFFVHLGMEAFAEFRKLPENRVREIPPRHGWPDDASLWQAQVAHFKSRYSCCLARAWLPCFGKFESSDTEASASPCLILKVMQKLTIARRRFAQDVAKCYTC